MSRLVPLMCVVVSFLIGSTTFVRAQADGTSPLVVSFIPISPFAFETETGEKTGFLIELARAIGAEIGVEVVLRDVVDSRAFVALQAGGDTQMIAGVARLPPLQATNVFSDPVAVETLRLVVASDSAAAFAGEVTGRRIGVMPPAVGSQVEELLSQNTVTDFVTPQAAVMALISGEVDGILLPNPAAVSISRRAGVDDRIRFAGPVLREVERVIALHESRADLLPAVNAAIAQMEADGRLADLRRRYFLEIPASQPEELTVGIAHSPPYAVVAEDGGVSGFAVEVFEDLAARAGLTYRYEVLPLEDYFDAPGRGQVDLVPYALDAPGMRDQVDISLPIKLDPMAVFVRAADADQIWQDFIGRPVGMKSDVVGAAIDAGFAPADVVGLDDDAALAQALADGQVDAVIEDQAVFEGARDALGLTEVEPLLTEEAFTLSGGIALRFGLGAARESLNAVIPGYLLSERFAALEQKYFGEPVYWTEFRIAVALLFAGVLAAALTAFAVWQSYRRRVERFARQAEDLVREKAHSETLKRVVSDLELANREQAEFTYAISHDLKSPNNTMAMLIGELEEVGAIGDGGHDILSDMKATNTRMGLLVTDVLDYARIVNDAGEVGDIDLNALVEDVLADLGAEIAQSGAVVHRDDLPHLRGHAPQLRMLFQNLLSNAIKFCAEGVTPEVRVGAQISPDSVKITVTDNGIGIPDDRREEIFGLFRRLHRRTNFPGTGLGLATARRVMTNHGGTLRALGHPAGGSVFEMTFLKRGG